MLDRVSAPGLAQSNDPGGTSAAEKSAGDKSDAAKSPDGKSAVDAGGWFAELARTLLLAKAGTALHYLTGYDERLCQRYAAGHVKPSAYFLRVLLRGEQGGVWLAGLMQGCESAWWREHQRAERIAAQIDKLDLR